MSNCLDSANINKILAMSSQNRENLSVIKARILQYLDNQEITLQKFYEKTKVQPSNFRSEAAKSELGGDKLAKILAVFPNLSPNWLMTGEGSMTRTDQPTIIESLAAEPPSEYKYKSKNLPPGPCMHCEGLERLIAQQRETLDALHAQIALLTPGHNGQKRKAG